MSGLFKLNDEQNMKQSVSEYIYAVNHIGYVRAVQVNDDRKNITRKRQRKGKYGKDIGRQKHATPECRPVTHNCE